MKPIFYVFLVLLCLPACRKKGPPMPNFTFENATQQPFTPQNIDKTKHNIFIFFHPSCHHCENEARSIVSHIPKFKTADIYWISKAEWSEITAFDTTFALTKNGMHLLRDAKSEGKAKFDVQDVPDILVYDTYQELKVEYVNEVKVEQLLKDIE